MQHSVRHDTQGPPPEPNTVPSQFGPIASLRETQVMSLRAHRADEDVPMISVDAAASSTIDQSLWALMPATHHQQLLELQDAAGSSQMRVSTSQSLLTCVDMATGQVMPQMTAGVSDTALVPVPHDSEFSP